MLITGDGTKITNDHSSILEEYIRWNVNAILKTHEQLKDLITLAEVLHCEMVLFNLSFLTGLASVYRTYIRSFYALKLEYNFFFFFKKDPLMRITYILRELALAPLYEYILKALYPLLFSYFEYIYCCTHFLKHSSMTISLTGNRIQRVCAKNCQILVFFCCKPSELFFLNCVVIESRVIVHFGSTVPVLVCGITVVN